MKIRSYKECDKNSVLELHKRALEGTGAYAPGPWNEDLAKIEEAYLENGGCFLLIEEDEAIIAMGALRIIRSGEAEIKRMRVLPKHQRRGLGQRILEDLSTHAERAGVLRLVLDTTEVQKSAQRFYEKNGFTKYGKREWNGFEVLLYEKRLSKSGSQGH